MEKQIIKNIANSLLNYSFKNQKDILLNSLIGHKNIKRLTEEQFDTIYEFCNTVAAIREELFDELVVKNSIEVDAIESLYKASQSIKEMIEEEAFGEFKRTITDILNRQWKKKWSVECRGNVTCNNCGTVQKGLKEFAKARWEFVGVNTKNMYFGNEYKLVLRVERDMHFADELRRELKECRILLPPNCIIGDEGVATIVTYNVQTKKPFATMTTKQMTELLTVLFTKELNYGCFLLVERFKDYK